MGGNIFRSLKYRLVFLLVASTLTLLVIVGISSYYSISLLENKVDNGVQQSLFQVKVLVEDTLDNLDHVALQLSYEGRIGKKLQEMVHATSIYEKFEIKKEVNEDIILVNYTNPNVGLMLYYDERTEQVIYQNRSAENNLYLTSLPLFSQKYNQYYYGPHHSAYKYGEQLVFSTIRPLEFTNEQETYVYIETDISLLEKVLDTGQYGMNATHLLVNEDGDIAYSGDPGSFPVGSHYLADDADQNEEYRIYSEESNQGWEILVAVTQEDRRKEVNQWKDKYSVIGLISLITSMILAWLTWRMIYDPLSGINKEIRHMSNIELSSAVNYTNIKEFDDLLTKFEQMKKRIRMLFQRVKEKEDARRELEVEVLLYKINPHFLYNTLNSIQWLARLNDQPTIDRSLSNLIQVLHHNLGKEGSFVTVQEEIDVLRQYVKLHQMRYGDQFDLIIDVNPQIENVLIPRFILQPIVENSIHHGLHGVKGNIEVLIDQDAEHDHVLLISISDNGKGISTAHLKQLLSASNKENQRDGMGIGLYYVDNVLTSYYANDYRLDINSVEGKGTTITLKIPIRRGDPNA